MGQGRTETVVDAATPLLHFLLVPLIVGLVAGLLSFDCLAGRKKNAHSLSSTPEKRALKQAYTAPLPAPNEREVSSSAGTTRPMDGLLDYGTTDYEPEVIATFWKDVQAAPDMYKELEGDARKAGYDLQNIGLPGIAPPSDGFSETLHGMVSRYTNYVHEWIETSQIKRLISPYNGGISHVHWLGEEHRPEEDFERFLVGKDPIFLPSLRHLLFLVRADVVDLQGDEKAYLELRLRWVSETLFPKEMTAPDWNADYLALAGESRNWSIITIFQSSSETKRKQRAELKETLNASCHRFVSKHLTDEKLKKPLNDMQTVWDAWIGFGKGGMSGVNVDPLQTRHSQFVLNSLYRMPGIDMSRRFLGISWLHRMALDKGKGSLDDQSIWKKMINGYELPNSSNNVFPIEDSSDDPDSPGGGVLSEVGGDMAASDKTESVSHSPLEYLQPPDTIDSGRGASEPLTIGVRRRASSHSGGLVYRQGEKVTPSPSQVAAPVAPPVLIMHTEKTATLAAKQQEWPKTLVGGVRMIAKPAEPLSGLGLSHPEGEQDCLVCLPVSPAEVTRGVRGGASLQSFPFEGQPALLAPPLTSVQVKK